MELQLKQAQKLIMTQVMQQSLRCLQLPALELRSYLQEAALSNPLLEVEDQPLGEVPVDPAAADGAELWDLLPIERREQLIWDGAGGGQDPAAYVSEEESFTDYLNHQLGQIALLDAASLDRCRYLVGCLNSWGYLDCPLEELAQELGQSLFDMEQALFVIQSLDPPGTGARSLSECLLLQLAEGSAFNEVNIRLIRVGLPLLARNDRKGLAALLGVSQAEAEEAADVIRRLNPIPSRGFAGGREIPLVVPEATICPRGDKIVIEMNTHLLPKVSLNQDYCALMKQTELEDVRFYLREKQAEANNLLHQLDNRADTLFRVLSVVAELQQDYFLRGQPLEPMTMQQVAERLGLSSSTVSRAVKDKYVEVGSQVIALRSLFSLSLPAEKGHTAVSPSAVHQQLRRFIAAEDPAAPLSDEALCQALAGIGIPLSRRTVAKYRMELGIPSTRERKKHS